MTQFISSDVSLNRPSSRILENSVCPRKTRRFALQETQKLIATGRPSRYRRTTWRFTRRPWSASWRARRPHPRRRRRDSRC